MRSDASHKFIGDKKWRSLMRCLSKKCCQRQHRKCHEFAFHYQTFFCLFHGGCITAKISLNQFAFSSILNRFRHRTIKFRNNLILSVGVCNRFEHSACKRNESFGGGSTKIHCHRQRVNAAETREPSEV